ncbi:MAG: SPW repeat protein [Candidatus Pacebacteria bacterium]|nr:SPW repeat protein [Candidatus Paceibacterota bacterium]
MIENWIELFIGALVLVSPWILGFADVSLARWLNMICGAVLVLVNVWMIYGKDPGTVVERGAAAPEKAPQRKQKSVRHVVSDIK